MSEEAKAPAPAPSPFGGAVPSPFGAVRAIRCLSPLPSSDSENLGLLHPYPPIPSAIECIAWSGSGLGSGLGLGLA